MTAPFLTALVLMGLGLMWGISRRSPEIPGALAVLLLVWLKVIPLDLALSGWSSQGVFSLAGMMLWARGLEKTGWLGGLTRGLARLDAKRGHSFWAFGALGAALSAWVMNTPLMTMLLPLARRLGQRSGKGQHQFLLPLGFWVVMGGNLTLLGCRPLLILGDLLRQQGVPMLPLWAPLLPTLWALILSLPFLVRVVGALGRKDTRQEGDVQRRLSRLADPEGSLELVVLGIPSASALCGLTRDQSGMGSRYRIFLPAMAEGRRVNWAPWRMTRFQAGQQLLIWGETSEIEAFRQTYHLERLALGARERGLLDPARSGLAEWIIPSHSAWRGKTLREISFRRTTHLEPLQLIRGDRALEGDFSTVPLQTGDSLLVLGAWEQIRHLDGTLDAVLSFVPEQVGVHPRAGTWMSGLLLGGILGTVLGLPLPLLLLSGALLLLWAGVIRSEEIPSALNGRMLMMTALALPLAGAVRNSGLGRVLGEALSHWAGTITWDPLIWIVVLGGAWVLGALLSNLAATVLGVPLVLPLAPHLGVNPGSLALLVTLVSSLGYFMPSHPLQMLISGPGGYGNRDILCLGLWLMVPAWLGYLTWALFWM